MNVKLCTYMPLTGLKNGKYVRQSATRQNALCATARTARHTLWHAQSAWCMTELRSAMCSPCLNIDLKVTNDYHPKSQQNLAPRNLPWSHALRRCAPSQHGHVASCVR